MDGTYPSSLVGFDEMEWIELFADAKDEDPAQGGAALVVPVAMKTGGQYDRINRRSEEYNGGYGR